MKAISTQTFTEIAGRYARVMGRQSKVNVVFGPYNPRTTEDCIFLPQLPAGTLLNEHQSKLFNGYLDHETGHQRYTDIRFFMSDEVGQDKCVSLLTNLFEDSRMENAQIDRYPGSKVYLDTIAVDVTTKIYERFRENKGFSKNEILFILISKEGYMYRGITLDPLGGWSLRSFKTLVPVADLMEEFMPGLTSTQDAYDLALKVKEYIDEHQEEIKEEMQQKNDEGGVSGEGGGQKEKSDEDESNSPGNGIPDFLNESEEETGGAPGQLTPGEHEHLQELLDKSTQLQKLLETVAEENGLTQEELDDPNLHPGGRYEQHGSRILPPLSTEKDKIWFTPDSNPEEFQKSLERVGQNGSGSQQALRMFLQSRARRGFLRGLDHGTLDMTIPLKVKMRHKDIYRQRRVVKRINTDILLLIDLSGSMPWHLTMDAAVSLSEALKPIQHVKLAIGGFCTSLYTSSTMHSPTMEYGRANPMLMPLFKGFNETYHHAKFKLGSIECNGLTPLGEAYGHGLELLAPRKTPRKILWLISDGMPYFDRGSDDHSDFILMRQTQRNAFRLGITTVGLEIGHADFLHQYVQGCARITDISEMQSAMHTMVHDFLGHMS